MSGGCGRGEWLHDATGAGGAALGPGRDPYGRPAAGRGGASRRGKRR